MPAHSSTSIIVNKGEYTPPLAASRSKRRTKPRGKSTFGSGDTNFQVPKLATLKALIIGKDSIFLA